MEVELNVGRLKFRERNRGCHPLNPSSSPIVSSFGTSVLQWSEAIPDFTALPGLPQQKTDLETDLVADVVVFSRSCP